ncbi:MAG TPA: Crp/Fnr family transcriptional regulator [Desulfomonilia bacterium]
MDIISLFEKSDLFAGMEDELKTLRAAGSVKNMSHAELLFTEGEPGKYFYLLVDGGVRLFKTSASGQEVDIRLVRPGEIFAELILFERDTYPVSAMAVMPSTVFAVNRDAFYDLLSKEPFRKKFIISLMQKQRYLAERIMYLMSYDVEERFFRFLLDHYGCFNEIRIDIPKKDIASAIGTIPETFSRLIARLKNHGAIEWEGNRLKVNPEWWEMYQDE